MREKIFVFIIAIIALLSGLAISFAEESKCEIKVRKSFVIMPSGTKISTAYAIKTTENQQALAKKGECPEKIEIMLANFFANQDGGDERKVIEFKNSDVLMVRMIKNPKNGAYIAGGDTSISSFYYYAGIKGFNSDNKEVIASEEQLDDPEWVAVLPTESKYLLDTGQDADDTLDIFENECMMKKAVIANGENGKPKFVVCK